MSSGEEFADNGVYFTLGEAAKCLPHNPPYRTLWTWSKRGVPTANGRVVLKTMRIGKKLLTCSAWLEQFLSETQN